MSARRQLAATAIGLALALGAGCAARPPAPGPALAGADEVRALLARRTRETATMTATFRLALHRADGAAETSRGAVVVVRPDRLRLQIFSFGVMTAYDYTAAGDRYRVRRPLEGVDRVGRFGEPAPGDAAALGEDLRPLFLLAAPADSARVDDAGERYRVTLADPGGRREIEVSKRDGRVERETLYGAAGEPRLAVQYGDYRAVDGFAMPFAIRVRDPGRATTLAIDVQRYTRNLPVDPKLFEF